MYLVYLICWALCTWERLSYLCIIPLYAENNIDKYVNAIKQSVVLAFHVLGISNLLGIWTGPKLLLLHFSTFLFCFCWLCQINQFVKRARAVKIHACIMGHMKKEMPSMIGKSKAQQKLIDNLEDEFKKVWQIWYWQKSYQYDKYAPVCFHILYPFQIIIPEKLIIGLRCLSNFVE
jgi:Domain of unknown function (DUF5600)